MPLPPAKIETRAVPVGGPRHYSKTCEQRGFHVVRKIEAAFSTNYKCAHCTQTGSFEWARLELGKEGDFYLELGTAVEDLAKKQIREYGMLFDSDNGYPRTAPQHAGGKA